MLCSVLSCLLFNQTKSINSIGVSIIETDLFHAMGCSMTDPTSHLLLRVSNYTHIILNAGTGE